MCAMTQPARETVLVVDDEEMVRRLAVRMLVGQGYRVLEASGGAEAVRILQRGPIRSMVCSLTWPCPD